MSAPSATLTFEDKEFTQSFTFTIPGGQEVTNIGIQLDKDADFYWCGLQISYLPQPFAIRLYDHTNQSMSSAYMDSFEFMAAVVGLAPPRLLNAPIMFPAGSIIQMDLKDLSGSNNGPIQFLFRGIKRFYQQGLSPVPTGLSGVRSTRSTRSFYR